MIEAALAVALAAGRVAIGSAGQAMCQVARSAGARRRPPRRAAPLLAVLLLAAAAPGGRAPGDTMPHHAPGLEDDAPRLARPRAMDQPGMAADRVRLGLLLPTGARGAAFAAAFGQALAAAAPAGVFGRRIEVLPVFADDEAAAARAGASLASEVLALVSGLAEAPQAAVQAAAGAIPCSARGRRWKPRPGPSPCCPGWWRRRWRCSGRCRVKR
ncbi:hypothetical protein ACFQU2_08835 [Siccirubricoccus deserti]